MLRSRSNAPAVVKTLLLGILLVAGAARASAPTAVYVVPTKVEFLPNQASATKVVIHGAFFLMMKNGMYGSPACGYMYFTCAAGSETMCRMQWNEIAAAIGGTTCEGFGAMNMVPTATLRSEGAPLGTADTWDLGMGISPGVFVNGACAPAQQLKCPLGPTPDMAMTPMDMSTAPADFAMVTPAADMAVKPVADMSVVVVVKAAGCSVGPRGGESSGTSTGFTFALCCMGFGLVYVLGRRRRSPNNQ